MFVGKRQRQDALVAAPDLYTRIFAFAQTSPLYQEMAHPVEQILIDLMGRSMMTYRSAARLLSKLLRHNLHYTTLFRLVRRLDLEEKIDLARYRAERETDGIASVVGHCRNRNPEWWLQGASRPGKVYGRDGKAPGHTVRDEHGPAGLDCGSGTEEPRI